ncbi:BofC C-terminal domain-containing protein [Thermohalobacter berrensis]|uniref:Bypass of forespore C C-terminal domain-containing protein n=1 Tax=Thermohalobacter berrensis TaxID=99594 RepID=A0A419TB10_9FIRM|nr:BofC C-terminal domain-containing protein [Thermohalobacter berrensis]RKD34666.1 hypothetical protein BET03_02230 [Thermohalobacter berrensis]
MRGISRFSIFTACLVLFIIGFLVTYFIENDNISEKPFNQISESNQNNNNKPKENENVKDMIISEENPVIISPNTYIEYDTYYTECGDVIKERKKVDENLVNMTEAQFREYISQEHPYWKISTFTNKKIVIDIKKEQLCPKHYIIGVKDNKIAIYRVDENGKRVIYQIIDKDVTLLKKVDQEKLKKGIIVNSKEEIGNILENFIS